MPTRRIDDKTNWNEKLCLHPNHNPPSYIIFKPGKYEHECPSCHFKTYFEVPTIVA